MARKILAFQRFQIRSVIPLTLTAD